MTKYDHPHPIFKKGDRVRVTQGPYAGELATIMETPTCTVCAQRLIESALKEDAHD